jgi:hypothetical protein
MSWQSMVEAVDLMVWCVTVGQVQWAVYYGAILWLLYCVAHSKVRRVRIHDFMHTKKHSKIYQAKQRLNDP